MGAAAVVGIARLYRSVLRATGRQQVLLVVLALAVAGVAAAPLEVQQRVINDLVAGVPPDRLVLWCGLMLLAIAASAGLKLLLNERIALVGEGAVRELRERLYRARIAAPDGDAASGRSGLVAMLASEAETVGRFAGAALAGPPTALRPVGSPGSRPGG